MAREGEFLTRDEVEELETYKELGLAPPDKYQDAVYDASQIQGQGYRWKTSAEKSAESAAEKEAKETAERRAKLRDKVSQVGVGANQVTARVTPTTDTETRIPARA